MSGNEDRIVDGVKTIRVDFTIPLRFDTIVDEYYSLDEMAQEKLVEMYETEEQELEDFEVEFTLDSADVGAQIIHIRVVGKAEFSVYEEEVVTRVDPIVARIRTLHCGQCGDVPTGGLFNQISDMEIRNMTYYGWICDRCYSGNYSDRQRANDRIWRNLLAGRFKEDRTRTGMPL